MRLCDSGNKVLLTSRKTFYISRSMFLYNDTNKVCSKYHRCAVTPDVKVSAGLGLRMTAGGGHSCVVYSRHI